MANKLRPGIIASVLLTIILSLGEAYLSLWITNKPLYASLGLTLSVVLILLSALVLKGNSNALTTLSVFYLVLSVLGLLTVPSLPSEGILLFIFSISLGSYLLRYRNDPFRGAGYGYREANLSEEQRNESSAGEPEEGGEIVSKEGDSELRSPI